MEKEKPLDNLVEGYSFTSIFRKVAFIGDSLSSGEFVVIDKDGKRHWRDMFEYSWGQFIARKNGFFAYNFSAGGMTAKWYINEFAQEFGYWDPDKACQAYVIALGVNDLCPAKNQVGTVEDITATEFEADRPFISYYGEIVRRYKKISPDAKFFFVTIPKDNPFMDDEKTRKMQQAMYALAEHFDNSYVIDLYKYAPAWDEDFRQKYIMNNHMNPMGYVLAAKLIDSYIDYIIRHNMEDFRHIGLLGTNIPYK
ncbi:MAG: SGNH/GDSL hydrolase family protein [Oscillospiraceae bacterium]|nr:SGNH/GDSL hydrolase family protein [Oscillospiraceae bacterium]